MGPGYFSPIYSLQSQLPTEKKNGKFSHKGQSVCAFAQVYSLIYKNIIFCDLWKLGAPLIEKQYIIVEGFIISVSKDICVNINPISKLAGLSRINKQLIQCLTIWKMVY